MSGCTPAFARLEIKLWRRLWKPLVSLFRPAAPFATATLPAMPAFSITRRNWRESPVVPPIFLPCREGRRGALPMPRLCLPSHFKSSGWIGRVTLAPVFCVSSTRIKFTPKSTWLQVSEAMSPNLNPVVAATRIAPFQSPSAAFTKAATSAAEKGSLAPLRASVLSFSKSTPCVGFVWIYPRRRACSKGADRIFFTVILQVEAARPSARSLSRNPIMSPGVMAARDAFARPPRCSRKSRVTWR